MIFRRQVVIARLGPVGTPQLGIAVVVPVVCLDGDALPLLPVSAVHLLLSGGLVDNRNARTVFIQGVFLLLLCCPLPVGLKATGGQHDVGMGIALAIIMDGVVSCHSPVDEVLLDVALQQFDLLLPGQLPGKGYFHFPGKLGVAGLFDLVDGVPERCPVREFSRGIFRQHDFAVDDAALLGVVVVLLQLLVIEVAAGTISGAGDGGTTGAAADYLYGAMIDCHNEHTSLCEWMAR